jgi:membrane fusion protein (multidrug efflux system)
VRTDFFVLNYKTIFWFIPGFLSFVFFAGCDKSGNENRQTPKSPPKVIVSPVVKKTIPIYKDYAGRTLGKPDVEIRARVEGFLEEKLFKEGSIVQKDQILYRIDDRFLKARVERERAELARKQAVKKRLDRDLARLKPLYETNAASQKAYEQALSATEEAAANLQVTQANLNDAELQLSLAEIKSPITGLAGKSLVHVGALVGTQSEYLLTSVVNLDPIHVRFHMTDKDYLV